MEGTNVNTCPRFIWSALATLPLGALMALSIPAVARAGADPHIATISISPAAVEAGQSAILTVELTEPAPAGGFAVGVSHFTNTGADDAVVNMPQSLIFEEGARRMPFEIRTKRATAGPTDISFVVFHGTEHQGASLTIR
jgi:hypothetical protein